MIRQSACYLTLFVVLWISGCAGTTDREAVPGRTDAGWTGETTTTTTTFPLADARMPIDSNLFATTFEFEPGDLLPFDFNPQLTLKSGVTLTLDYSEAGGDLAITAGEEYSEWPFRRYFKIELPGPDDQMVLWGIQGLRVGEAVGIPGGILAYLRSTDSAAIVQILPAAALNHLR